MTFFVASGQASKKPRSLFLWWRIVGNRQDVSRKLCQTTEDLKVAVNNVFSKCCVVYTGSEFLAAVVMQSSILWDKKPCNTLKVNQRFGERCRLHLQQTSASYLPWCWFLSRLMLRTWRQRLQCCVPQTEFCVGHGDAMFCVLNMTAFKLKLVKMNK